MKDLLDILVLGDGGREAAIVWKLRQSRRVSRIHCAPRPYFGATHAVGLDPFDFAEVANYVAVNGIDLVIPGNENIIAAGIADFLEPLGVKVIAPSRQCAALESSKEYAKEFMSRHAIPTARFMTVTTDWLDEGMNFLDSLKPPYVLKADGLAHGKGVILCHSLADAKDTLSDMLEGLFGEASSTVIIEEFIAGRECSVFLAVDGEDYIFLPTARDYKQLRDNNNAPNTAGMGAVSPVPYAGQEFLEKVEKRIVIPTLRGLKEEGLDYRGFLFLGVMELEGEPLLIEYNVRLGDPEAEVVLPRLESDFVDLLEGIADRTLAVKRIVESDIACAAVVACAEGYPGPARTGDEITGLASIKDDCLIFPGAMKRDDEGRYITSGGRVITLASLAADIPEALARVYECVDRISFQGKYVRADIGSGINNI